ncbi:MAG TPA: glucose-6-phosphate isomerase [Parachlamydiales bacterium]|nr:glucose-6-phosphate isomerase [Parachlamydiales bacterium]
MFMQTKSFQTLLKLSQHPVDLTKEGTLTPERIGKYAMKGEGFDLLYGTERVDDEVIEALWGLAEETDALKKMGLMQGGEVMNRIEGFESENRSVLHTAMRDVFTGRREEKAAREASDRAMRELEKLREFLKGIDGQFTDLVQIGIGGSDLGPRALSMALEAFHLPHRRVHFISNVDPDDANLVLSKIDPRKTLVVVVSKSGSTLETLTNEEFVRERFSKTNVDPKKHFVAVTGEKSPMDDPSRYLASFYIWDFVGGRYSATSMVGAVMLGFALGYEKFMDVLKGAHEMDVHARTAKLGHNLPLFSALLGIWNRNFLHLPTVAVIPYSQALIRFPAHLQQLDMESNGKSIDKQGNRCAYSTGPVIWGEPGTNGQHSFYQLIHQGADVIPLEFIGFRHSQHKTDLSIQGTTSQEKLLSNLFAQSIALAQGQKNKNPNKVFPGNRPNRILLADRLDAHTLGALLAYYEHKVAFQGFIWNINSFDQEGVQLGKVLASKILSLFAEKKGGSGAFPLGEALLKFLK